jgi:hypothetical protein
VRVIFCPGRSIADPRRAALVLHAAGFDPGSRGLVPAFALGGDQRLDSLPVVQLAFPVLVEPRAIAIAC